MELEIKVISGKNVKSFTFFQKLQVYAVVSITTDNGTNHDQQEQKPEEVVNFSAEDSQEQRTPVDEEDGDGNPEWNRIMRFNLDFISTPKQTEKIPIEKLLLHFQLRHRQFFGDKVIGDVFVPFTDLIDATTPVTPGRPVIDGNQIVRFVDYQVKSPEGSPNGVLSFSYKIIGFGNDQQQKIYPPNSIDISGYPNSNKIHHSVSNQDQGLHLEPWNGQYPTIYPPLSQPAYTSSTASQVTSSAPPPPPPQVENQDQNQGLKMDPWKVQYPTIHPSEYSSSGSPVTPSAPPTLAPPPPQPASGYDNNVNGYYNYPPYRGEFHQSNSMPPHYLPGPPPLPPLNPMSPWEPPPNSFSPRYPPPFPHNRPLRGPRHPHGPHHHSPFHGPHFRH